MGSRLDRTRLAEPVFRALYTRMARRALGWETGTSLVAWAGDALAAGWDTLPLAVLAALDVPANEFEVDRYLPAALESLALPLLDKARLANLLAWTVADELVSGAATPAAGAKALGRIGYASGAPALLDFVMLEEWLCLAREGIYGGTVEGATQNILDAAKQLLVGEL